MTEAQRTYLGDLAIRKGIKLGNTAGKSVSWASEKIEELKGLPDANLPEVSEDMIKKVDRLSDGVIKELNKWTFTR